MLTEWTESGVGRHYVESLTLKCETEEEHRALSAEFEKLNRILSRHGVRYALSEHRKDGTAALRLTVFEDLLKRNAGPRKKHGSLRKVGEVYQYRQSHSAGDTALYAGLKPRSYQRRVKKHMEEGSWNGESSVFF